MNNRKPQREVDLTITDFSKKGNGLAWLQRSNAPAIQAEIPFTAPGDVIRAKLLRKREGMFYGKLQDLLETSPLRISPKCIHFGICGGCRFQHISHEDQLQLKEKYVRQCFSTLPGSDTSFRPIVTSGQSWGYRNKMDYTFSSDSSGNKYLGMVMEGSKRKVVDLNECYLTSPWFIKALHCIKRWWNESSIEAYHLTNDTGSLRSLTLREGERSGDRMVILTVSGNPDYALQSNQLQNLVIFLKNAVAPHNPSSSLSIFLRIQQVGEGMITNVYEMLLYGPGHIRETLYIKANNAPPLSLSFEIGPSTFFQPNTQQTDQLYSLALNLGGVSQESVVYDLYCGGGTLGICFSKFVKRVIGVELSPEIANTARTNAERNGCNNVTIISGAVRHLLDRLTSQNIPPADLILVNPSRTGMDPDALSHLLELNPPKILYIASNPITQVQNISQLLPSGYRIQAIQPVDLFPQTNHVANIALLDRI